MNYEEMTNQQLLEEHNRLAEMASTGTSLKSWAKKKGLLIERIENLKHTIELDKQSKPRSGAQDTIRETSLELLCEVDFYEDKTKDPAPDNRVPADHPKARSVGFTYNAILDRIRELHPGAKTSAACLRWYSVKVRDGETGYEDYRLAQRRPRPKMPKREK